MLYDIETPRLLLRDLLPTDDAGMFELDSDPDVHTYLGGNPVKTMDEITAVIAMIRKQYEDHRTGRCAVIEKASGKFIGWAGLKFMTTPVNGHIAYYDVGYRYIKKYWGKGYGTEAAEATLKYAWQVLQLERVSAFVDVSNTASIRILEKVGLVAQNNFMYDDTEHTWFEIRRPLLGQ
jgi:[ribosomal protein S5]-alanine N-acetyltransferase